MLVGLSSRALSYLWQDDVMAQSAHTIKKSVTIDADVLSALDPERTENLSATVNESLRLIAALDKERRLVESWEAEQGRPFTDEELRPYVELILTAEVRNALRARTSAAPSAKASCGAKRVAGRARGGRR